MLTLHNQGPQDFREHCLVVAGTMLEIGKLAANLQEGKRLAEQTLQDGRAWEKFTDFVAAQGGDTQYVEDTGKLPLAPVISVLESPRKGYIQKVDAHIIGETAVALGAGRALKGDEIDPAVGIQVHIKVGDVAAAGSPLFTIHARDQASLEMAKAQLRQAVDWSDLPVDALPLFYSIVRSGE